MQFSKLNDTRFPKLDDTRYPNIDTVDVYKFKNTFDYTRWIAGTKITLTNVLWNGDYKDVVKFDNNNERDEYFDNLDDKYVIPLKSNQRIVPDAKSYNYVDLPVPYDVAARYNYIIVDIPIATSEAQMIDYETADGVRRWYFFLEDISYAAPNNTTCYVSLDVWTNFINDVLIKYMVLERGHAPVAATDADAYLANPIDNNQYLLAPDVDFGGEKVSRHSRFIPFGNGKKYVCFASTVAPYNLQNMGTITHPAESSFTPPTYYDEEFRSGFQYGVNGYGFGNGSDYNNLRAFADNNSGPNFNNNLTTYAIPAIERNTFLSDVKGICPQFLRTIVACFVVDENMINLGTSHTFANHTIYEIAENEYTVSGITLNKGMFHYPERYQKYAKLYTFPYATLELTDNDGKSVDVRIENTSTISAHVITGVMFPYLNLRCFFDGINGVGSTQYTWQKLDGTNATKYMYQGDWFRCCFGMDIPTYAVYMDGETAFMLDGYSSGMDLARRQALVSYHNSVRSANTSAENAIDSSNVAHTNNYEVADTSLTNNDNDCNTKRANADIAIATSAANTAGSNKASADVNTNNIVKNSQEVSYNNGLMIATTDVNRETTVATTTNSNNAMMNTAAIQGAVGGAQSGMSMGMQLGGAVGGAAGDIGSAAGSAVGAAVGAPLGAALGAVESLGVAGINADCATSNAVVVTQGAQSITDKTVERNNALAGVSAETSGLNQTILNDNNTSQTNRNNDSFSRQTDNNIATSRTNANNNATTSKNCADRTRDNSVFCTNENRYTSIDNAKNVLENTQNAALARLRDAQRKQPISVCSYGGEFASDYNETRGVQIKVKTQNQSAIAQTGDTFARYGYALNQVWDVAESGLKLMKNFTFWKADDIWIDDTGAANNNVIKVLTGIFNSGVTVWNDADKIGKVSVYDN